MCWHSIQLVVAQIHVAQRCQQSDVCGKRCQLVVGHVPNHVSHEQYLAKSNTVLSDVSIPMCVGSASSDVWVMVIPPTTFRPLLIPTLNVPHPVAVHVVDALHDVIFGATHDVCPLATSFPAISYSARCWSAVNASW